jgi:protein TonB
MRYAAIVVCTLLALAWKPSQTKPILAQQTPPASAKANPDASGKYHLGDGVTAPKLVSAPDPEFTAAARRKKLQGVVVISMTVDTAGNPQDVRVARSMAEDVSKKDKQIAEGLDQRAVEAVKQYKFQAGQFQGKPVPVEIEVRVNFRIF